MAESSFYSKSKLCNILFTIALAERLSGTQVTVNTLHPGPVKTDFGRHYPVCFGVIFYFIFGSFFLVNLMIGQFKIIVITFIFFRLPKKEPKRPYIYRYPKMWKT